MLIQRSGTVLYQGAYALRCSNIPKLSKAMPVKSTNGGMAVTFPLIAAFFHFLRARLIFLLIPPLPPIPDSPRLTRLRPGRDMVARWISSSSIVFMEICGKILISEQRCNTLDEFSSVITSFGSFRTGSSTWDKLWSNTTYNFFIFVCSFSQFNDSVASNTMRSLRSAWNG